ncbi:hypothetical protein F3J23_12190 [Chryseobacterium sp. Tr-659]|uniref:tetratricopeptide repeat protein n=1 Tax=Chryseobacterium sp. Tr-659 TaxID=2608340 RepID=UPI00142441D7|nr:hypothetical protein [Chryseobacterium sp. Tr-659]NIF06201.1 hypothetical protein [Chryseobacterium sp. Tr-659]
MIFFKKNLKIFILLPFLQIILWSCGQDPTIFEKEFDTPLMNQNEKFRFSGDYDALVNLNKSYYKRAERIGYKEGKALCYINLAQLNMSLENFQKAQVLLDNAEEILRYSENNIHKAIFYNIYSRFNAELRRNDKAFEYNNKALSSIMKAKHSELKNKILFYIYLRRGEFYVGKKQNTALKYFQKADKLDKTGLADCAISDYIYVQKNKDSAYKYISRAYAKMRAEKRNDAIALNIYTILGEYFLFNNQYDHAEKAFQKALEIDKRTSRIFANYTKYIYNDLRTLYEKKGDKEKAYTYLQAYTLAKNRTNTSLLATINQDMESFIDETVQDSEKRSRHIRWIVFFSFIGLALLGIYTWRIILQLRKRKSALAIEAEMLKNRMNDNKQEELMELVRKNDAEFLQHFKEVYPDFIKKLLAINPDLENSELSFCAMLKLHFTSKEIAAFTLIQHRTVQQKKYRIRKRLNIPTETDIYHFFDVLK